MKNLLPITNENGCFEIRLESIGGLGANLCGKMLGELGALYLSLNASSFSSYGSEKRGSPVKAFVRWCEENKPIRVNSPITNPHILVLFHQGLLGKHPVLNGVTKDTKIVLNTTLSPKEACEKWDFYPGTLYCIDALSLALKTHSRINMVMLGALVKASGFLPLEKAILLCKETIGQKYPNLIEANLLGLQAGYEQLSNAYAPHEPDTTGKNTPSQAYTWGYDNAPIGGVNPRLGSTVSNDLSPSREGYIPLFIPEKCINCGFCDSTCPDFVFQFSPGIYQGKEWMVNKGLDYTHCKGCLRCVDICPTGALQKALEQDYEEKPFCVPNRDLMTEDITYEESGPDAWITGESYLTEKRVDGGVV